MIGCGEVFRLMRDRSLKGHNHWEILGKRVCLKAFKRLHSIGYFSVVFRKDFITCTVFYDTAPACIHEFRPSSDMTHLR